MKETNRAEFTKAMKDTHTILLPDMLHYHNELLRAVQKAYDTVIRYLSRIQHEMNQSIAEESRFVPDADFAQMKEMAAPIIHSGCHTGDGWLVAAEVADLIEKGYESILIVHPFGCLVSHVCERGIMKKLHERYPNVNIQTVEYDYDSARTLRESRILLGISGGNKEWI